MLRASYIRQYLGALGNTSQVALLMFRLHMMALYGLLAAQKAQSLEIPSGDRSTVYWNKLVGKASLSELEKDAPALSI